VASRATLWPWAALLAVVAKSFAGGGLLYGEHDHADDSDSDK
jgi:hypothetical protein